MKWMKKNENGIKEEKMENENWLKGYIRNSGL